MRSGRSAGAAGLEGLGAGDAAGGPVRLLRPGPAGLPHLPGQAADARPRRRSRRPGAVHRARRARGPAGVPAQRPHGVRLGVRARRLPRARLHGRLPAPRVGLRQARLRRQPLGHGVAADRRGVPHQPLRRGHRDADADRRAGRGAPPARRPLQPLLLRAHDEARAARGGDHRPARARPAHRVLRLDGVGGVDRAAGPRLLLHEQLAARAARGQRADGQRDRLERAVADRAAGRHRDPVRRLRALAVPGLARARAGDAVLPRARRRGAHAGAARHRLVLLRDGGAVPDPDVRRRRVAALPGRAGGLLRLRPRRRSSPTT